MPNYDTESAYTPVADASGELAKELENRRQWVQNWISNPEFKKRARAALNRNAGNVDLSRISKYMAYNLIPNTSEQYAESIVESGLEGLEDVDSQVVDFGESSTKGEYAPDEGWMRVDQRYVDSSTPVHEFAHASNVDKKIPYINQYDPNVIDPERYTNPDYIRYWPIGRLLLTIEGVYLLFLGIYLIVNSI